MDKKGFEDALVQWFHDTERDHARLKNFFCSSTSLRPVRISELGAGRGGGSLLVMAMLAMLAISTPAKAETDPGIPAPEAKPAMTGEMESETWRGEKGGLLHGESILKQAEPQINALSGIYRPVPYSQENLDALVEAVQKRGGFATARSIYTVLYPNQNNITRLTETILPYRGIYLDNKYNLSTDTKARILWLAERYEKAYRTAGAIVSASEKTGVDIDFMVGLAGIESTYRPDARAGVGSASGLYQFIRNTWLSMVFLHGDKYGLAEYQSQIQIEGIERANGTIYTRYFIADEAREQELLDKRFQPEIAALMAAQFALDNAEVLKRDGGLKQPNATDLYMAHFFGAEDAALFFKARAENPYASGAKLFPKPAQNNRTVFYKNGHYKSPRNLTEIYGFFEAKMDKFVSRYKAIAVPDVVNPGTDAGDIPKP